MATTSSSNCEGHRSLLCADLIVPQRSHGLLGHDEDGEGAGDEYDLEG